MEISFIQLKTKQAPSGNNGLGVTSSVFDSTMPQPSEQKGVIFDTNNLTVPQQAIVTAFIDLCNSKLP